MQPNTDQLTGNNEGFDALFSDTERRPSLFTKEHGVNVKRSGIITKAPFDKQSRFMDEDELGNAKPGALKFWGEDNKPTDNPAGPVGTRKPVMDTVFPVQTDYRDKGAEDDGSRAWYVGGKPAMDAIKNAIQAARLTSREQMVGMRLTVWRTGKSGRAWKWAAELAPGDSPAPAVTTDDGTESPF